MIKIVKAMDRISSNKDAILQFIADKAENIEVKVGYYEICECIKSPENQNYAIIIDGVIEGKIEHDPGNYHQGLGWEWTPFDFVSDWDFYGDISIVDDNEKIIQKLNYNDLIKPY